MKIKDLFKKNIEREIQGVVVIGGENENQRKQELEEYVCTAETKNAFKYFFNSYSNGTDTDKMGVWVTGFFGSGKSHFLKILGYILENKEVGGKKSIEYFRDKINDSYVFSNMDKASKMNNKVILFNIDSKSSSDSKQSGSAILEVMYSTFNDAIGYCGSSSNLWVSDMEYMLDNEGTYEQFKKEFEIISGKAWTTCRNNATAEMDFVAEALANTRKMSFDAAFQYVMNQINNFKLSIDDFAKRVNEYCTKNKTRVVFLMDEVGQFVGTNTQMMLNLQTCVEDLGKYCRGNAWVVVTSQQELKEMLDATKSKQTDFSKIQGRFATRITLSGADADEVIKTRLLEKKPEVVEPLKSIYEANEDRLKNLILFPTKPTWCGYQDAESFSKFYPFIPYQVDLLQKVFNTIRENGMSEGKHLSQGARSMLSAFQESAKARVGEDTNVLVPFDSFYSTLDQFIDYDIKTVFFEAQKKATISPFAIRVLEILFMIKFVKDMTPTVDRIATLMVSNINEDKAALKIQILDALKILEEETYVQKNGDEYNFLTNEEQNVNRQIAKSDYSEGEVQRKIQAIIFEKILDYNKYKYDGRYEIPFNRYVDEQSKGSTNPENITVKILTQYSGKKDQIDYMTMANNTIIVNLQEGSFIDELIRAERIDSFKRNNSSTMSVAVAEIMQKKALEKSERLTRAEEFIRAELRSAKFYYNGAEMEIPEKEAKERISEALKQATKRHYMKINDVKYFYNDQRSILDELDAQMGAFDDDLSQDSNKAAYDTILSGIKDDKSFGKTTTVKSILDKYTKAPYGWREYDILGILAKLWKTKNIQFLQHNTLVQFTDRNFKNNFKSRVGVDAIVVRITEKIDDAVLYKVKKIMKDVYGVDINMTEEDLKKECKNFFNDKLQLLNNIKIKQGGKQFYPGSKVIPLIAQDFNDIIKSDDALNIFNKIIQKKDDLEDLSDKLEKIVTFYTENSSQSKNFETAKDICDWYRENYLLDPTLDRISDTIDKMNKILSMEMPFDHMSELATLVMNANQIKDHILQEKLSDTNSSLSKDLTSIKTEYDQAMKSDLNDEQKSRLTNKYDDVCRLYDSWSKALTTKVNLDQYINASDNQLKAFKKEIEKLLKEPKQSDDSVPPTIKTKRVRFIDCVPTANKNLKNEADIDNMLKNLKDKLMAELNGNDEINLD